MSQAKSDELVAEAAVVAAQSAMPAVAAECLQRVQATRNLKARALAGLAKSGGLLCAVNERRELAHPGSSACVGQGDPDAKAYSDVLNQLVSLIDSAVRHHAATPRPETEFPPWGAVIEDAVGLVWRAALPILQYHRRGAVKPSLQASLVALEAVQSTDARLRQRLHHEVALCEAAEDQLAKAVAHVKAAIAIAPSQADVDAELRPLADALSLRLDSTRDETGLQPLERA
jgi:hypothetical protein